MDAENIRWEVGITNRARKGKSTLPSEIMPIFMALFRDLALLGPSLPRWPHFGKVSGQQNKDTYHCHLNRSRPTYVVIWKIVNKKEKLLEISYVGTHENAPY